MRHCLRAACGQRRALRFPFYGRGDFEKEGAVGNKARQEIKCGRK